jgi:hypothetical protein
LRRLGWRHPLPGTDVAGTTKTESGGSDQRPLVADVLAAALQGVLVESGRARWRLSWSGPAELIDERGETVPYEETAELARRAVADRGSVAAVRAFLARYGIADSHRPARLPQPAVTGYPGDGRQ